MSPADTACFLFSPSGARAHAHLDDRAAHHSRQEAELRPDRRRVSGSRPDPDPDAELRAIPPGRPAGDKREDSGLEGVFREIFPIESYDKTLKLEYLRYDLGKPRYDPDECRQLRLTFGRPLHVWLRLNKGETTLEESVYLGDMPIMIGGGEFIINGAERVVVSQLHRSPGVDFVVEIESNDKKLHACRVIPGTRKLDRAAGHQERHPGSTNRPVGQVLVDDPAARDEPEILERRGHPAGVLRSRFGRLGRPQGGRQARRPGRLRRRRRPARPARS